MIDSTIGLSELMARQNKWATETFHNTSPIPPMYHLKQEVQETIEALEKGEDARSEFADCLLLLFNAAAIYGLSTFSMVEEGLKKQEINMKRKWGRPDANGVVNHIKEPNELPY